MAAPAPAPELRGRFLWYELMTTDMGRATEFYSKALGWGSQPWPGPTPYMIWTVNGQPASGVMDLPPEARAQGVPPHWTAYIGTSDVDATVARATELGATVLVPPMDIPKVGRFATLKDPQGAVFAVYKPADEPGPEKQPTLGHVSWHELTTTDYAAAYDFYRDLFGWDKTTAMDMGAELGTYQMFGRPGLELGGMWNKPPDMPAPPHWLLYVRVDDIDKAIDRIKEHGGKILNGPMPVPGGNMIAQCLDPQGAAFAVHAKGTPAQEKEGGTSASA